MATRTRTGNRTATEVVYRSKSDHVRTLLDEGKTIAEITRLVPGMGYAFAYGIAKRYGKNLEAADRRKVKTVQMSEGTVTVQTAIGPVIVNVLTGEVTKPKVKKVRNVTAPTVQTED